MCTFITHDQLDGIIKFLNGEQRVLDLEAAYALSKLNETVQFNLIKELTGARKRNAMLSEKIETRREVKTRQKELGEFKESGLDSADVAEALLYQLQQLKTYRLSAFKVNTILFEMYASWLYSKGERLFVEHPVANEHGPRFWHAFKRINPPTAVPDEKWKAFAARRPDIAAFCRNAALKYYDIPESTITGAVKKTDLYRKTTPEYNNGKWNKEIPDTDIYRWKQEQKEK